MGIKDKKEKLWKHQDEALEKFLFWKHGILEMATGTGKTYTAFKIMNRLLTEQKVKRIIVITYGNDLLWQWYQELLINFHGIKIFRFFDKYKEFSKFMLAQAPSILILSREANRVRECLNEIEKHDGTETARSQTMLIFDEIHGLGAPELRKKLIGKLEKYTYRLGLSATPERDYDDAGNEFIKNEIGDVIYQFGLKEAIESAILCPFSYIPLTYDLTEEERKKKKSIIVSYEMKRKRGIRFNESDIYRDLARVNKTASLKIPIFENLLEQMPELLDRCIIFVEDKNFGVDLQKMLIRKIVRFHTYYSEDAKENLVKFSRGEIDCLITCKKLSEGIDIRSVKNIILFSSDRGKIVTIQRIGRSLRRNPAEPEKKACVVDFIYENGQKNEEDTTTDMQRMIWLSELAKVREKNEII